MSTAWAQPLQRQLLAAIVLLLVPILGTAVWLGAREFSQTVDELSDLTQTTARRTAMAVERELTGFERMARNLSSHPAVQTLDPRAVDLLRPQRNQRPSLRDLALMDSSGRVVARADAGSDGNDQWPALARDVVRLGARVLHPLQRAPSGQIFVSMGYPVRDVGGTVTGALAYDIEPGLLQDVFRASELPAGSVIIVTQADGRLLTRDPVAEQFVGRVIDLRGRDTGGGSWQADGADGVYRMFSRAVVPGESWVVTVGIPMSVAHDRAGSLWMGALPILAAVVGGWLLLAFVFGRRLTRSVRHLEGAAQRIAAGDFSPIVQRPMATREFALLQDAFDRMVQRFNETRAALDAQMAEERRMREEVESLQRQIIRQERLAAVGQLVSGVAHEINNPLQAILGFAELLQMQGDASDSVRSDLTLIQKESARACGIIRNLAMFARQQTGDAEPVSLTEVIQAVAELRQRRLESENIELRIEAASRRRVLAVLAELQQVVLNFVVNAEQAIVTSKRQPGRIALRTYDRGDRVVFEVEDTGPGVSAEDEAKLFQPFFTTKPPGEGTGLGLSVSYGIIDSLGGQIGYRSAVTGGAIFYFELPATSAQSTRSAVA